ncbi:hypothetical protein ABEF83_08115 [Acinetobacter thermotolerans]|uniref:Bbp19 family protein n=1 Tax=Acinetobacter thermotolerans TaxID=3151487 RepID=UPI00325AE195
MIVLVAVLAIALLIVSVMAGAFYQAWQRTKEEAAIFEAQMQFYAEQSQKKPEAKPEVKEPERGAFVKVQITRIATPETYRNVFDLDFHGQRVLAHLTSMYANKSSYVRGGHDAERESCFRAGQADVIGFIYKQINRANDPDYKEEVND